MSAASAPRRRYRCVRSIILLEAKACDRQIRSAFEVPWVLDYNPDIPNSHVQFLLGAADCSVIHPVLRATIRPTD